jgi:outer membrane immunogenic protein
MTKVFLAVAAAIAMTSSAALGADVTMPLKAPAPAAYDWGGFYVGGHVGWTGGTQTDTYTDNYASTYIQTTSYSSSGFSGGVQGGYNWVVTPRWLLGLEADGTGSTSTSRGSGCTIPIGNTDPFGPVGNFCENVQNWESAFVSFRGRIGFIWDNLLFYALGGYAAVDHRNTVTITCANSGSGIGTVPSGSCPGSSGGFTGTAVGQGSVAQTWANGWVYGAGLEWGFADRWTARFEYTRYRFDYTGGNAYSSCPFCGYGPNIGVQPLAWLYRTTSDYNSFMVGLNYLFWPGM